jgi:protein tyrosine/serine phosphatase
MSIYQKRMRHIGAILVVLLLSVLGSAETRSSSRPLIRIKNFGQINENYYRGAQPETRDYADLAALGVRTVIDLTRNGRDDERHHVERVGMQFYRIPLTTSDRPSVTAVNQFLKLVTDPDNFPVYVHCQGGRHRTGVMTAVYRMTQDGWNADRAYQEMKRYRFEGFFGHPTLKKFVYEYYSRLRMARQSETVVTN